MHISRVLLIALISCLLLVITGCVSQSNQPPRPKPVRVEPGTRVDFMELYSAPAPVNWDDNPQADGVRLRLFFYQKQAPSGLKTTVIENGRVQVMIFEGGVTQAEVMMGNVSPFKLWEFNASQLAQFQGRVAVGTTYAMQLGWENDKPRTETITLLARYLGSDGRIVYAKPLMLSMLAN